MMVHEGQAYALQEATRWVQQWGLHNVAFLSDSQILVEAVNARDEGRRNV
ncbi:hypothetical protein A2U01_0053789 [Trifolium medium]|uniref:RNase H type-1 domain-containing protein n=1 Tax=Trifolium medium TaxID=97028 RepID=A0A392RAJ2_9FABA|nr:hypothetical protein [Trifolium medium]